MGIQRVPRCRAGRGAGPGWAGHSGPVKGWGGGVGVAVRVSRALVRGPVVSAASQPWEPSGPPCWSAGV